MILQINKICINFPSILELEMKELDRNLTDIKSDKGIYFLFDSSKNLLYIGITQNLRNRLCGHLWATSNRCDYSLDKNTGYISPLPLNVVKYLSFIPIEKEEECKIAESLYHYIYHPIFNNLSPKYAYEKYCNLINSQTKMRGEQ